MELKISLKNGEHAQTIKLSGDPKEWFGGLFKHIESFTKLMYDEKPKDE